MRTVVALYDRFEEAQQAVSALHQAGFSREDINLVARDASGTYSQYFENKDRETIAHDTDAGSGAASGAGIGAILGGLGGLLVGLGALAIPGIGPVIAAGPIMTTLAGAGIGAVAGGIVGALVDLGIPEEHAQFYAEGIRRGGTLVIVRAGNEIAEDARMVMNRFNPVDIDTRSQDWQTKQWRGFDEHGQPLTADEMEFNRSSAAVPVTGSSVMDHDRLTDQDLYRNQHATDWNRQSGQTTGENYHAQDVDHRSMPDEMTDTGGMESLRDSRLDQHLNSDIYGTERVGDEDRLDIPVTGYEPRPVEEVDQVDLFDIDNQEWANYDQDFRSDYRVRYGMRTGDYSDYLPAYQYGYTLAKNARYTGYDWERMEPFARQDWEQRGISGAWEDVKDAVHHAWETVTNRL